MVADSFGCAGDSGFYAGDGWRGGGNVEYAAEAAVHEIHIIDSGVCYFSGLSNMEYHF
ncbi:hypothetical protein Acaty_m0123 (plasmid) [Acidithiobacillus caldus ATCC 51756]|uniref:Uncharacterized protein n=1 Tax=Acidithiobacillus caldus (strain ATCC 51756 / DSM 8584 / KU) TaxID=637389 RepID=A0A060A3C2_ACICK|nr:hypothetical protein Acaty_m0123 [Acidithiobacillus caldus ATCC 51756]